MLPPVKINLWERSCGVRGDEQLTYLSFVWSGGDPGYVRDITISSSGKNSLRRSDRMVR